MSSRRQLRIVVDDVLDGQAFGQSIQDDGNLNPRVADTGPSAAYSGVNSYPALLS